MPPEKFRVALVQMSCGPEPEKNLEKALGRVADAAGRGAKVVCLPELFQTQYFCQREDHSLFDLAEPIPGPSSEKIAAAARSNGVVLIASLFERRAAGVYHNTAAIFDSDGSLRGLYRKMHIPDDPLYYEKFYFTPGDLGFRALDTSAGRLGTLVCWDQWYPEGARLTALGDVDAGIRLRTAACSGSRPCRRRFNIRGRRKEPFSVFTGWSLLGHGTHGCASDIRVCNSGLSF